MFLTKDQTGEGDLKMDQIRDTYTEFCGRFVEKEEIDSILEKCNVQVHKRGLVKYSQFVQIKSRKAIDACKAKIRRDFQQYDEKRALGDSPSYVKQGYLYKSEVRKMIGAIVNQNNNHNDDYLQEQDKDGEGYYTIESIIGLVISIA